MMAAFVTHANEDERQSPLESDYFAQAFINKKFQAFDLELYNLKWFDYRFMTPLEATKTYIGVYGGIYRRIYAREIDRARSEFVRPITFEHIKKGLDEDTVKAKRAFTGCWRGRQFADALGMPYEHYIELAFTYRMRAWNRPYLPQPEHLYHQIDLEKIQNRWEELQPTRLWTSDHPAYLVHNYADISVQNDYHEWLFKQAALRGNAQECLARLVNMDQLPVSKVRARLTEDYQLDRFEYYLQQAS
jgi:hypothetical protein